MIDFQTSSFRFQTGSIKRTRRVNTPDGIKISFDSKLVRLKVSIAQYLKARGIRFDSKLVRLKGGVPIDTINGHFAVSIPNWFD